MTTEREYWEHYDAARLLEERMMRVEEHVADEGRTDLSWLSLEYAALCWALPIVCEAWGVRQVAKPVRPGAGLGFHRTEYDRPRALRTLERRQRELAYRLDDPEDTAAWRPGSWAAREFDALQLALPILSKHAAPRWPVPRDGCLHPDDRVRFTLNGHYQCQDCGILQRRFQRRPADCPHPDEDVFLNEQGRYECRGCHATRARPWPRPWVPHQGE